MLQKDRAGHRMESFWLERESDGRSGRWLQTPDPRGFVPWFSPAVLCALVLSVGRSSGNIRPGKVTKPLLNPPSYLQRNSFLANSLLAVSVSGFLVSRAPNVLKDVRTWATAAPPTNFDICWGLPSTTQSSQPTVKKWCWRLPMHRDILRNVITW